MSKPGPSPKHPVSRGWAMLLPLTLAKDEMAGAIAERIAEELTMVERGSKRLAAAMKGYKAP